MKNRSPLVLSSLAAAVLCWGGLVSSSDAFGQDSENGTWLTDFALAQEGAAKQGKDLFFHFTGSDWGASFSALRDQVLTNPTYTERAGKRFVLVEVDFPRNKPQSDELKKQNEMLRRKFAIKGYPTLLLADAQGRAYSQVPNQPGLAADQLASQMEGLQSIRERRDALLKAADTLQGMERAEKLNEALGSMDGELAGRYHADIVDQIIELDEKDKLNWKNKRTFSKAMDEMQNRIHALAQEDAHEDIAKAVDEFIEKQELKGEQKQRAMMLKLGLFGAGELAAAADFLLKIIEIESDSDTGQEAAEIQMRLNEFIAEDQ